MTRSIWVLAFILAVPALRPVAAQHHGSSSDPTTHLYDNLGTHHRSITISADAASPESVQQYFDQGMRLAYAFARRDAAASFREAQRLDPNCAMCYWGEAWALGPYINEPLYDDAVASAYEAAQQAKSLTHRASPIERALIGAMAARYAPAVNAATAGSASGDAAAGTAPSGGTAAFAGDAAAATGPSGGDAAVADVAGDAAPGPALPSRAALDSAYADAMRDVVHRFPDDLDAAALHAEALMVLRPWDHWTPDGLPQPGTDEAIAMLEGVLARDILHAGACHLYIHIVEASPVPERAEACADHLAAGIPGASHIQHMPSHIYMNIGRYGDSVRANQIAWQMDQRAHRGEAVAIYPEHNLHMLVFAGWMDGQSAVAIQAARDLARISTADAFYPTVILARFGRWDEVLEMGRPADDPFQEAMWSFGRGLSHLRMDQPDSARSYLERLAHINEATPDSLTYGFVGHRQTDLLNMASGILRGELAASEGRYADAVEALEQAIVHEDNLAYDEPEPWPMPTRHVLGAVLLEADRPADAERVYREALNIHPANGWSLYGLAQSLAAQGRDDESIDAWSDFERVWARADVALHSSRF